MTASAIIILATAICGLATGLIGLFMALRTITKISKIEVSIDGRLSQLLDLTKKSSFAEGMIEGEAKEVNKAPGQ